MTNAVRTTPPEGEMKLQNTKLHEVDNGALILVSVGSESQLAIKGTASLDFLGLGGKDEVAIYTTLGTHIAGQNGPQVILEQEQHPEGVPVISLGKDWEFTFDLGSINPSRGAEGALGSLRIDGSRLHVTAVMHKNRMVHVSETGGLSFLGAMGPCVTKWDILLKDENGLFQPVEIPGRNQKFEVDM